MELYLKITAWLLLFVHLAALPQTTDSPGRTIDKSWLRDPLNKPAKLNATDDEEDTSAMGLSSEVTSGFMVVEPEPNLDGPNNTTPELLPDQSSGFPDATVPAPAAVPANTSLSNTTRDDSSPTPPPSSATGPMTKAYTGFTELESTTVAPQTNAPQTNATQTSGPQTSAPQTSGPQTSAPQTSGPQTSAPQTNATQTNAPQTSGPQTNVTQTNATQGPTTQLTNSTGLNTTTANTATPELNGTSAASPSSTSFPFETTEASPSTVASTTVDTHAKANNTDKEAAPGERGFAPDPPRNKRYSEWAAVLGTMLAVTIVGLVAYVVLKSRRDKGFSHRKLVEEYPSDPVLRLDNSEPLDLNFSGSAYYNAGLQGDNIQMTNFPGRH